MESSPTPTPAIGTPAPPRMNTKVTRLCAGSYAIGEWRVMRSTRMRMTLWFVWRDGTLTKNIWHDENVRTFVSLTEAKTYINSEESK
jgi:hypothetical protein